MTSFARRLLLASCICSLALPSGCGDDAPSTDDQNADLDGSVALADASPDSGDDDLLDDEVPCDATYPSFKAGMSVPAGTLTAKLLSINPAPPRQKVSNKWVVQIVDASGAPVTGVTLSNGDTYMPVHRHHGNAPPTFAAGSDPGSVQLNGVDFIMRGPWQVIFDVQQGGAKVGTATFQICVE